MTPAELAHPRVSWIEIAMTAFLEDDHEGAAVAAQISQAASLALMARPPSRSYGEYDRDATVMDREEIWHHDEDRQQRHLREARVTDLDRRLDTIERQLVALANSLRTLIARVDKLEDEQADV